MHISIDINRCWIADESDRMNATLRRFAKREYWRKRVLDIEEHDLPDYARPLKFIPRMPKKGRFIRFLKCLIP